MRRVAMVIGYVFLCLLLFGVRVYCPVPMHETICDDGYDQDHDHLADCDDPDCSEDPFCDR